jgi:hypothetical protein
VKAVVDLARTSAVEEDGSERKVVKSESGSSKVGLLLMELFTGKVIVMMMLVLVVSALLEYRNQATQKDLGLHTLVALYEAVCRDSPPLWSSALAVVLAPIAPLKPRCPKSESWEWPPVK